MRAALTSLGPVIGVIRNEVGFSNWSIAILTSLPLVIFSFMSIFVPKLTYKFTSEKLIATGLIALFIGILLRSVPTVSFLFLGTLFIGLGIAICNVLLPGLIKRKFPNRLILMTGLYSTGMGISATIASALSIPVAEYWESWRLSLLLWTIPAILGVIYLNIIKRHISGKHSSNQVEQNINHNIWKSKLAWNIALFMACHSLLFYIIISWLPEIFISFGIDKATSGYLLSYLQFIGIPASLIIPLIANKYTTQTWLVVSLNFFFILGIILLLLYNSLVIFIIASTFIGVAISGNFTLSLVFLSLRTNNSTQTNSLSGMAQAISYSLAALGPVLIGLIHDITLEWYIPLSILILLGLCSSFLGMEVGQNKKIED